MKKVMVFGTFDILHQGHLEMFKQARDYGDHLTVVVARDKTVEEVKKRKVVYGENQRLEAVKPHADSVVLGNLNDKYEVIRKLNPDIICIGYDQEFFLEGIRQFGKDIKKLKAYKPDLYKSSFLREKL